MSLGDDGYGGGDFGGQDSGRAGGSRGTDSHLTRTRLPEGDGDPYGPPRRPAGRTRKSSRNLVTVVGVVVLLIAAIAFANRGGGSDGGGDSGGSDGAAGNGTGNHAQPTAPTGERPVTGRNGGTNLAAGFPHTAQGAQSAAANFAVALGSSDMLDRARRHDLVADLFTRAAADGYRTKLDRAYSTDALKELGLDANGEAGHGMTYVSRTAPVGTRTIAYAGGSAKVDVWCTGVFGTAGEGSTNPVSNDWFTMTLDLRWSGGDWKIEDFSQKDGPAPVNSDRTASTADEIAKAVEQYGGFTYAR